MSAVDQTVKERGGRYGLFIDNAELTQSLMEIIQNHEGYEKLPRIHRETFHMIFHKMARMMCGDHNYLDNVHDIAGYATALERDIPLEIERTTAANNRSKDMVFLTEEEDPQYNG